MGEYRFLLSGFRGLLLALWITAVLAGFVLAYDLKEYFPLEIGDSWTYVVTRTEGGKDEHFKRTVKAEGKEAIQDIETTKLLCPDDESECLAVDSEGVKRYKSFSEDSFESFKPSMMLFPGGLTTGESREYKFDSEYVRFIPGNIEEILDKYKRSGTVKIAIEAIEDLEGSGGKFAGCLKFSSLLNWKDEQTGDYAEEKCTTWLAPGTGIVKRLCEFTDYEIDNEKEEKSTELLEFVTASIGGKIVGYQ